MNDTQFWQNAANWAAIGACGIALVGAIVGLCEYIIYRFNLYRKRKRLEKYLSEEKRKGDKGQRSLLHIVCYVGLTQDEIIKISFKSPRIKRKLKEDEAGFADKLLFECVGEDGRS